MPQFPEKHIDLHDELVSTKAGEAISAFAGVRWTPSAGETRHVDGLLAVSCVVRPNGSGYLSVNVLMDIEHDPQALAEARERFAALDSESFRNRLGKTCEFVIRSEIDFEVAKDWLLEDITFYFTTIADRGRSALEQGIIPELQTQLPLAVDELEWMPEARAVREELPAIERITRLRATLQDIFS
jgi:hypothetical protein